MTHKQKAIELEEKYEQFADYQECDVFTQRERMFINAKQCALIAVDEILQYINRMNKMLPQHLSTEGWQEVKQEIDNL